MTTVLLLTTKAQTWTSLEGTLVRELPRSGVRPVLVSAEAGPLLDDAAARGVVAHVLPGLRDVRTLGGLLRLPQVLASLRRLVRDHDVDLVHSLHGSTTPIALLLSRLTALPHLCHMQFLYDSPGKYCTLWLDRVTDVVAVARAVLDAYREACGGRRVARAHVIHVGVDAATFVARSEGATSEASSGSRRRRWSCSWCVVGLYAGSVARHR